MANEKLAMLAHEAMENEIAANFICLLVVRTYWRVTFGDLFSLDNYHEQKKASK